MSSLFTSGYSFVIHTTNTKSLVLEFLKLSVSFYTRPEITYNPALPCVHLHLQHSWVILPCCLILKDPKLLLEAWHSLFFSSEQQNLCSLWCKKSAVQFLVTTLFYTQILYLHEDDWLPSLGKSLQGNEALSLEQPSSKHCSARPWLSHSRKPCKDSPGLWLLQIWRVGFVDLSCCKRVRGCGGSGVPLQNNPP